MGIISTIKSLFGAGERREEPEETTVTVEREPDASSERAVKEPDRQTAGADAAEADESAPDAAEADESDPDADDAGEPVEEVKGIGPAYAGRLEQAGVSTVAELADADAVDLAGATDISETRIRNWIERAQARRD